jgi:hypothetical protein
MLHQHSLVWIETADRSGFQTLTPRDVSQRLARQGPRRRVA